jgi:hypothetical protein
LTQRRDRFDATKRIAMDEQEEAMNNWDDGYPEDDDEDDEDNEEEP